MKNKLTALWPVLLFMAVLAMIFYFATTFENKNINWGVNFSQMQAQALGLNWKEAYLSIINDLNARNLKLHTQWNWVEGEMGKYYFDDIDWQLQQADKYGVNIIYVVGLKTGRWPECHAPEWLDSLSKEHQQEELLKYIKEVVLRYKNEKSVAYWQIENEPFIKFGECPPWYYDDKDFVKKEVELVKSLDPLRQIIISDSGELSWWFDASKIGDILGTTMYRKAWVNTYSFDFSVNAPGFYGTYPIPPAFYFFKAQLIKYLFNKDVICVELQAEPWASKPFYDLPLQEQQKTMNPKQFDKNVEYAKRTGLDTFYFWGAEWWYWMKTKQNQPEIWQKAQKLFIKNDS